LLLIPADLDHLLEPAAGLRRCYNRKGNPPITVKSMSNSWLYERCLRPLLFCLDPEDAHALVHRVAALAEPILALLSASLIYRGDDLKVRLAGRELSNPVGLAAGFDKNGSLVHVLGHLGFAFAEIGSVTASPSAGNPRPRLFRLPEDDGLINRLGLNGDGADLVAGRLSVSRLSLPVGLNIAKTNDPAIQGDRAIEDILYTFKRVKELPLSYVTVNASCPNTREGRLAEKRELAIIFAEIQKDNPGKLPVFVKLSPDSSPELLEDIAADAIGHGLAGYVCGNTTVSRINLRTEPEAVARAGQGGLSGRPLKPLALELCRRLYKVKGPSQQIIGVGGIMSGQDAYDFVRSGASAVEVYTGLVYKGPTLPRQINEELSALLKRDGLTLASAIGADCA